MTGTVSETKLVPSYLVGKRDAAHARAFMLDLSSRLTNRIQLSSDALKLYVEAVEAGFGGAVDYATIVKSYEAEPIGPGRYSPPKVTSTQKTPVVGNPVEALVSTSYIERQNLTVRMSMRRFTRLTNAFSKKAENLRAAVDLHFAHYNLCRSAFDYRHYSGRGGRHRSPPADRAGPHRLDRVVIWIRQVRESLF